MTHDLLGGGKDAIRGHGLLASAGKRGADVLVTGGNRVSYLLTAPRGRIWIIITNAVRTSLPGAPARERSPGRLARQGSVTGCRGDLAVRIPFSEIGCAARRVYP